MPASNPLSKLYITTAMLLVLLAAMRLWLLPGFKTGLDELMLRLLLRGAGVSLLMGVLWQVPASLAIHREANKSTLNLSRHTLLCSPVITFAQMGAGWFWLGLGSLMVAIISAGLMTSEGWPWLFEHLPLPYQAGLLWALRQCPTMLSWGSHLWLIAQVGGAVHLLGWVASRYVRLLSPGKPRK